MPLFLAALIAAAAGFFLTRKPSKTSASKVSPKKEQSALLTEALRYRLNQNLGDDEIWNALKKSYPSLTDAQIKSVLMQVREVRAYDSLKAEIVKMRTSYPSMSDDALYAHFIKLYPTLRDEINAKIDATRKVDPDAVRG